jgi:hypothetical protein
MGWLKSKFSSRSLFGENSLFGQATSTLADANFQGFGLKFGDSGRASSPDEAELLKYGMIGLFVWMIVKK